MRPALVTVAAALPAALAFVVGIEAPVAAAAAWLALVAFAFGFRRVHRTAGRASIVAGTFLAVLCIAEIAARGRQQVHAALRPSDYNTSYYADDDVLGYTTLPGGSGSVEKWYDGELVYSTTYTMDEVGGRRTGALPRPAPEGAVLCFGGSYMFGEGLADDETVPHRAQEAMKGTLRFYNLSLHGWGPHHMLARLDTGRVEEEVRETPRVALYWAIPDHAARAAGKRYWDRNGPHYEADATGRATRLGSFVETLDPPPLDPTPRGLTKISWVARELTPTTRRVVPGDVERWGALVATARDEVESRFPGCAFHVLFEDRPMGETEGMLAELEEHGVRTHLMSRILPGFLDGDPRWTIHPSDVHPSAAATERIADYVVESIVEPALAAGIESPPR
ncbi:MAG: hypothetical protein AAF957_11065 [Planctomycetota bacterium]